MNFLKQLFYREPKTYTYEHKGYILEQTSYNWHYMIFKKDTEQWVCHASCRKKLTEEEAKQSIETYLMLISERNEWKINPDGYYPYCSKCRYEPEYGNMTKYCPECGAVMNKVE